MNCYFQRYMDIFYDQFNANIPCGNLDKSVKGKSSSKAKTKSSSKSNVIRFSLKNKLLSYSN